ncbi:unnamed protein product [Symbiodinium microadriaticum]|nr:unnamed protein product [Symbiodinium microadriaticum]
MQSDGVEANIKTYGKLMEAAAQVGDVHATKKWLEELRASCFTPDVDHYNMMARAHFKAQNFLAGRQWLFEETFRDRLAPDIVSYNELLAALGELGDQNAAADMLLEAQEQRLTPNLLSYNAAIHSCAQCGDAAGARSRLEEIRAAQLAPDATSYNSLLHALARSSDVRGAQGCFEEMKDAAIRPDAFSRASLIRAASAKPKGAAEAEALLEKFLLESTDVGLVGYSAVVDAFAKAGMGRQARKWFGLALEARLQPDVVMYNSVINSCTKEGRQDDADVSRSRELQLSPGCRRTIWPR